MIIDPTTPVYNTIIFYIMIVCIILITKPEFMYCDKIKQFKPFGCNDGHTVLSFPFVAIGSGIALYIIFLFVEIGYTLLEERE